MHDADVRPALLTYIRTTRPHARVMEELGLRSGRVRVDVAALEPGELAAYELKADTDNLRRLPGQVAEYSAVFDRCTVVTGGRHLLHAAAAVPRWWGVMRVREAAGAWVLELVRESRPNPSPCAASALELVWRAEMLALLESRSAARGMRTSTRERLRARILELLTPEEVRAYVRQVLVSRTDWR
ncbi:sce7726 family protein [Myxococcus landrumensis]|uniref:Sce7726 family protein n=1 Tax=Myxococcus landrumensis TaxID=2813577 RepID=A0ABX7NIA8_9BACT|nr:sce7726 family protein [Myxococcus landrumus]QSQ17224.1 sce7726 family protein [Myxococcus landrumus]